MKGRCDKFDFGIFLEYRPFLKFLVRMHSYVQLLEFDVIFYDLYAFYFDNYFVTNLSKYLDHSSTKYNLFH